jgi:hypothetical protein
MRTLESQRGWTRTAAVGVLGLTLVLTAGARLRAADVETRDFTVRVDGKPCGDAHMTFNVQQDGTVTVTSDTDIVVKLLVGSYRYAYRGREVWRNGRLVRLDSTCNDGGNKAYVLTAVAEGNSLRVRVDNKERLVRGDVWLTGYWAQPDARVNQEVPILDADNGRELSARVQFVGIEQRPVVGQTLNLAHYRLSGKVDADLWYDGAKRLVRQEWVEDGRRVVVELARVRR